MFITNLSTEITVKQEARLYAIQKLIENAFKISIQFLNLKWIWIKTKYIILFKFQCKEVEWTEIQRNSHTVTVTN